MSTSLLSFLLNPKTLIQKNSQERPTAAQLLRHTFFGEWGVEIRQVMETDWNPKLVKILIFRSAMLLFQIGLKISELITGGTGLCVAIAIKLVPKIVFFNS